MYYRSVSGMLLSTMTIAMFTGCGSSSGGSDGTSVSGENDLVISTRIDDTTGFLNLTSGAQSGHLNNAHGSEIDPSSGFYAYDGHVFTSGSMVDDLLVKYEVTDDGLEKVATLNAGEFSIPTSYTFVSPTKAYVALAGVGKMLIIDPTEFTKIGEIDLTSYAMGENDNNPEPADAVIRDDKLYVALGQIDSFQTYACYGQASLVIIDIATDTVEKHITDDRTCSSGNISPNVGLVLDEQGDIYINNPASFGYYPGYDPGFLRIKAGEDEFDPDYFFDLNDLTLDVEGGEVNYAYNYAYAGDGVIYTTLMVPALTSSPPDYAADRNFIPYRLDLPNKTATKVDLPATTGWSSHIVMYDDAPMYMLSTTDGNGLYRVGDTSAYISTDGMPVGAKVLD